MEPPNNDRLLELLEFLREGSFLDHPAVHYQVRKAIETGDHNNLEIFLDQNPAIVSMSQRNITVKDFQRAENPFRPYPTQDEAQRHLSGPIKLGYVNEYDDRFGIIHDILCMPVIIAGRVGSGKSVLIKLIAIQLLLSQKTRRFNVLIPDLKMEYRHLLPYARNLKILRKDKIKFNPFRVPSFRTPMDHIVASTKVFISENYLQGTSLNEIINILQWIYRDRGIFDGSKDYPTVLDVYNTTTKILNQSKYSRYIDVLKWLQNRLRPYTLDDRFDCKFGIPFEVFRDSNLVLEMDTGFTDNAYNFTVAFIADLLFSHNKKLNLVGSRLRTLFVVDESRILFTADRNVSEYGESILPEIFSKSRVFGIGIILGSQETSSFNRTLRANAFLKIAFPLNDGEDVKFISESCGLDEDQKDHIYKLPPFGQAVVRYGGFEKPFLLAVPPFKAKRELTDQEVDERMSGFYAELDKHIQLGARQAPPEIRTVMPPAAAALLFYLGKDPFTKKSDLLQAPGFKSPAEVNKIVEWLEENGYVRQVEVRVTKKGRKSVFTALTEQALAYLESNGPRGHGGFEHCLYQEIISKYLQSQGKIAKVEGYLKSRTTGKSVDILSSQKGIGHIAYEITLHFENLVENILNDIAAGAGEVIIVVRDRVDLEKATRLVEKEPAVAPLIERVSFQTIDFFFD